MAIGATTLLSVTSPTAARFSKFSQHATQKQICNKVIIKWRITSGHNTALHHKISGNFLTNPMAPFFCNKKHIQQSASKISFHHNSYVMLAYSNFLKVTAILTFPNNLTGCINRMFQHCLNIFSSFGPAHGNKNQRTAHKSKFFMGGGHNI